MKLDHEQTPREIVRRALTFDYPERMPRHLWISPWAELYLPDGVAYLREHYPDDVCYVQIEGLYRPSSRRKGHSHKIGTCVDDWGCVFTNIQDGVIGEVATPLIASPADWSQITPPYETLPADQDAARDRVNRFCAATDRFVLAYMCARTWERYQFLRTSEEALCDMMDDDPDVGRMLRVIHEFYLAEMSFWTSTDVDGIFIMDDWGTQRNLLINPELWRQRFKPIYRDYCELAHSKGKFLFMHSDGQIADIYPDLVELGVDAVNSQVFCMDRARLADVAKGKLTFWGEIDRQHALVSDDPQLTRDAVRDLAKHFYDPSGGIFVQFEIGPGAKMANALAALDEWEKIQEEMRLGTK